MDGWRDLNFCTSTGNNLYIDAIFKKIWIFKFTVGKSAEIHRRVIIKYRIIVYSPTVHLQYDKLQDTFDSKLIHYNNHEKTNLSQS